MERRFWVSARKQSQQGGGSLDGLCRTRQTRLGASLGRRTIPGQLVLAVALLSLNACVQASEWGQDSYDSTETEAASFVVDNESTSSVLGLDIDTVWWESNSTPGFRGQSYAVAPTTSDNSKPARFWFKLSQGGCFEVSARWTSGENRSKAVLFRGQNQNGTAVGQVEVDQIYQRAERRAGAVFRYCGHAVAGEIQVPQVHVQVQRGGRMEQAHVGQDQLRVQLGQALVPALLARHSGQLLLLRELLLLALLSLLALDQTACCG